MRAVELGIQGAWTNWDLLKRRIVWPELRRLEPFCISFLVELVNDMLPASTNLHRWRMREDPLYKLSRERVMLAHIVARYKTPLSQVRYRYSIS